MRRREAAKREPEGAARGKRTVSGVRKTVAAAISKQLTRVLGAWHAVQAAISKQLTTSFRAWSEAAAKRMEPVKAPVAPPKGMEAACHALRAGTITFAVFERATRTDWDKLAQMLFNRWPLPAGVQVADVRQELLLAAVVQKNAEGQTLLMKWEADNGVPLARFITWNAIVWASRWIHDQRGVFKTKANGGSRGRDRGNIARPISGFVREDGSSAIAEPVVQPEQGEGRAFEETMEAIVSKLRSERDRMVLGVYLDVGGSVKEAAAILAQDAWFGMTERQAVLGVHSTLERTRWAAERVMAMQAEA